jgi:hypothetical protein
MDIGVPEFAARRGLSERRVLQLIKNGDVRARRSSARWFIDVGELSKRPNLRRPMSPKMANAFINLLSHGDAPDGLDPVEISRLRNRLEELHHHENPAWLLSSWLRKRAEVIELQAHPADLHRLLSDKRIIASGINDPRSGISANDFVEGYVQKNSLKQIQKDYLLIPSEDPNVLLRIISIPLQDPLPLGFVMADLADHNGQREESQVKRLLRKI